MRALGYHEVSLSRKNTLLNTINTRVLYTLCWKTIMSPQDISCSKLNLGAKMRQGSAGDLRSDTPDYTSMNSHEHICTECCD